MTPLALLSLDYAALFVGLTFGQIAAVVKLLAPWRSSLTMENPRSRIGAHPMLTIVLGVEFYPRLAVGTGSH